MAFSNARYDTCAYKQFLAESIGTMNYTLDPCRYYHPDLRRLAFGIVGGNDVSITRDPNARRLPWSNTSSKSLPIS